MRTLITLLLITLLAGCATTGEHAFYERQREAESAHAVRMAALSDAAACNGDATCVVATKAIAGLTEAAGGRAAGGPQQYIRQAGAAERVTLGLLGALPGLGQVWATVEGGKRNVDIARINADREIGMADAWAGVTSNVAAAFGALPPSTYIGSQHIGDTVGRDNVRDGSRVGDETHISTGDINTGTQIDNAGNLGTGNRQNSPNNTDTGNTGPRCDGEGCQRVPAPEPEPEG